MITVYLALNKHSLIKPNKTNNVVVYLQEPLEPLSSYEFYSDIDALDFSYEDFSIFCERLKANKIFKEDEGKSNLLINEQKKYIFIRLFNLTKLINTITNGADFILKFDKKVLDFPVLTVLLGDNKESPKVFLHDIRDTLYPLLCAFYGKKRCFFRRKRCNVNLYLRTYILFLATFVKNLVQILQLTLNMRGVPKYSQEEFKGNACLVFVRNEKQFEFLERIASNPAMENALFFVFSELQPNRLESSATNIKFIRLSRKQYLFKILSVSAKLLYGLSSLLFTKNSLEKNRIFELSSNFTHQYWFELNALLLDAIKPNFLSIISFEMVGRHAQMHQLLCKEKNLQLHRFQVASIEPRHVAKLTSYGKFWALDSFSYAQLKSIFAEQISFDNYISPRINAQKLNYSPKRILFATQPYGEEVNYIIISTLLSLLDSSYKLVIRRHPRDKLDYLARFQEVEYDDIADAIESVANSGLVVSKTSTILQECYNLNVPYIAVLYDNYSQTVELKFTKVPGKFCKDEKGFGDLIRKFLISGPSVLSPAFLEPNKLSKIAQELFDENI